MKKTTKKIFSSHYSDFRRLRTKVNRRCVFICSLVLAFFSLGVAARDEADQASALCERAWQIKLERPHDAGDFTQGLVLVEDRLFESAGQYGRSTVHEIERHSGRKLRAHSVAPEVFAEGLAYAGKRLIQLSWREQTAWTYDLKLRPLGTLHYPGEGWGLTTLSTREGEQLVLSDGTPWLRFLHPNTLAETGRVMVRVRGQPLRLINELEAVKGEILANIWHSDEVAVIDPASGAVRGWFNFAPLRERLRWPEAPQPQETDLNGLAWDEGAQRLLVTGKYWPALFELEIGGCKSALPIQ